MPWTLQTHWQPTRLMEVAGSADTSTGATEVNTDAGRAYIKPMGNRQGPHVLATDWVGTHLARWFGLSTFDVAILTVGPDDTFPLPRGYTAESGPTFAARAMAGDPWGKSGLQLDLLVNPDDITRLVVFDTWTLNCDRYHYDLAARRPNPDNVYLSSEGVEPGRRRLVAIDHGLCFIRSGEDLTAKLSNIDKVHDEHVYGLFPEFRKKLSAAIITGCAARLREMDTATAEAMIATVPREWEVSPEARMAWAELIYRRAGFVADNVRQWIELVAPWFEAQGE
ncbi:MAG TPA: HipA family kinase [Acidobacteriaceae bacterium]|nr:HipA family kinase [Acidobacteriaceae bacterium]